MLCGNFIVGGPKVGHSAIAADAENGFSLESSAIADDVWSAEINSYYDGSAGDIRLHAKCCRVHFVPKALCRWFVGK